MIEKTEAEAMREQLEAEHELEVVQAVFRHLADPGSELRSDIDTSLEPWREKWREILKLEEAVRS